MCRWRYMSYQSEWTRPLCITSYAFSMWLHYRHTPAAVCAIWTCRCIIMPVLHPAGVASCQSEWARLLWVPLQKHSVGGYTINILSRLCVLEWTCLLCVLSVRVCSPLSRGRPTSAVCVTSEAFSRWLHYQYTSTTACAICTCWCIVMTVYDACVASCQFEWTRPLCITSEALCRWLHYQYAPTVVCAWMDLSAVCAVSQWCQLLHQDGTASGWYCIMLFQQQVVCVCHFRSIL